MYKPFLALSLIFIAACAGHLNAQTLPETKNDYPRLAIKTNLLYDATATINLGAEFRTGLKTSLDVPFSYNPWTFGDNRKWKHFLVQPGFRLWTNETFRGAFFGVHAHYAFYNVSRLPSPPFSQYMADHRFEGWLAGAGVSYGYRWNFGKGNTVSRWAMEAEIGMGYAYLSYDKYPCYTCGKKIASETKNYFGPTKAAINLIYTFGAKRKPVQQPAPVYVPVKVEPQPEPQPKVIYQPLFEASFITPEAEAVKQRAETGKAYLDFAAGKSVILPDYRNNASELAKIDDLVREVKNNPDATITGITITGYASPEGTYASNLSLSEKRAAALKEYIRKNYTLPEKMLRVEGKGEDWTGLEELVSNSAIASKSEILSIIRSTDIFDGRERKLMQLAAGAPYKEMLASLFPQLRRVEYNLAYTVKPFTVEQGKEVFRTKPSNLSLNEMFLIAQTYEPGSEQFNEVFETAARLFPTSDTANLNAAASAIDRKDAVSAQRYLDRVTEKTAAYWNNAGIVAFLQGNAEKAAECFAKAKTAGNAQATGNLSEVEKHIASKQP